jgi:hypothetical protein
MFWQVMIDIASAVGVITAVGATLKLVYSWGRSCERQEAREHAEAEERAMIRQQLAALHEAMIRQAVGRKRTWRV